MVCYVVPTTAGIVHYFFRRKIPSWKNNKQQQWLSMLFMGGAIFGIVDHLWNGELFLIGEKPVQDLMLGLTITLVTLFAWAIMITIDKASAKRTVKTPTN